MSQKSLCVFDFARIDEKSKKIKVELNVKIKMLRSKDV